MHHGCIDQPLRFARAADIRDERLHVGAGFLRDRRRGRLSMRALPRLHTISLQPSRASPSAEAWPQSAPAAMTIARFPWSLKSMRFLIPDP
jgi:hypothetical protein